MTYRLLLLAALLSLVVGMVLLSAPQRDSGTPTAAGGPPHDPGYSAVKARLVQTGLDGRPMYTLDAEQIQQQANNGLIELEQVQLGFRDASGNQWTARARHGELAQGSGLVKLDGDVHVAGLLPGTQEPAEITSEHLSVDTNAQIVTTRDPVTFVTSGRELHGTGMVASLKERHMQLESDVHGSFLP
ncbi:MAG TPA: LPS export ABC transporter periplasmic protein LptC [Steroidobacteraceae bacterium]|nr:LPS export ABC transporter periplasmic protein LptC [Steroidobacteraceae bacterium]